jgi:polyisoprenoid-binding protein YceI
MYKKITSSLLLLGAVTLPAFAADTYDVEPNHTFPRFEYNHLGFSTHQLQFDKTSGTIVFDRAAKTGSVDITIDTTSIDAGSEKFEEHLRSDDFFDTAKYPTATFKSDKVKFKGDIPVEVEGDLTLHGITKTVTLKIANVKFGQNPISKKDAAGAQVTGVIKRSDFGLGKYVPLVSDEVTLRIQVEAVKE